MRLAPWLACAFLAVTTIAFGTAYFAAQRYAQSVDAKLEARDRLDELEAERLLPVPSLKTVQTYGPPYNVTITCTVAGSSDGQGRREPLNVDAAPRPGDVYVKTCIGTG